MNLREATQVAYKVKPEWGIVEAIKMAAPPEDINSYIVQVRTKEAPPRVFWLGDRDNQIALNQITLEELKDKLEL